ncbi:MAG: tetratricopeptide repeat protein [Chloroflexota bacterium]|nr:tetratricopeptide repeat protein [Chloroflexota bacterium]
MFQKSLFINFILFLILLMPVIADAQAVPNFRHLQQRFDSDGLNNNLIRQLGNDVQVQLRNPSINDSCHVTPLTVCLTFMEDPHVHVTGLKVKIKTSKNRSYNLISDSNGRSVFKKINIGDFPLMVSIPIINYQTTIINPIRSINQSRIIELLNTCSCSHGAHDLLIKRLIEICGNGIINVNITEPVQKSTNRFTPLRINVAFAMNQNQIINAHCLDIFINRNDTNRLQRLKTDENGEAVFSSLTSEDFPLTIDIPIISYHHKIEHAELSVQYREQLSEEQARNLLIIRQLFDQANICYRGSRFNETVDIYSRIIEMAPDNASAFNNRGNAKYLTGNINGAIQDFVRAIEIDPYYDNAYHNLGNIYLIQKNFNGALEQLNQAINCNAKKGRYYYTRAGIYCNMKQLNKALEDFNRALTYNPYLWEAFFDRGGLYYEQGRYREAVSDFSKVLELNPKVPKAYFYRAIAYSNINENQQACVDLSCACKLGHQEACRQYVELSCN